MARRRRDTTTADDINVGDTIITPNGLPAKVHHRGALRSCTEPNVTLGWDYPDDFTVNAHHRGQSSGRTYRPDDEVTRWV